jgi:hypothetical protein
MALTYVYPSSFHNLLSYPMPIHSFSSLSFTLTHFSSFHLQQTDQQSQGPIILKDTKSMHGVYVNGKRITNTAEIIPGDIIAFGNKVTRAEGDYLSSDQAFSFFKYPLLTLLSATHDGVSLTVGEITRGGAIFSNAVDLIKNTYNTPPASHGNAVTRASYCVPDYETDSSKENSTNTTFEEPTSIPLLDFESGSSLVNSQDSMCSEDEDDEDLPHYGSDSESDLGSDHEGMISDEYDDDDQSVAGSDCSGAPCSVLEWEQDDTQRHGPDYEVHDPLESHGTVQTATVHVNDTELVQPKATCPQVEKKEKEKARGAPEIMSVPWILEPTDSWNTSSIALTPSAGMPPHSAAKDVEVPLDAQKSDVEVKVVDQDKEQTQKGHIGSLEGSQIQELEYLADLGLARAITDSQDKAAEVSVQSNSPVGSKRKRDIEDDGHGDAPTPSDERKPLWLKANKEHLLKDFFNQRVRTTPRPLKRAKRSTARFALGAIAGAIGGVATVVGVLMTPACEELLANWPIA